MEETGISERFLGEIAFSKRCLSLYWASGHTDFRDPIDSLGTWMILHFNGSTTNIIVFDVESNGTLSDIIGSLSSLPSEIEVTVGEGRCLRVREVSYLAPDKVVITKL